MSEYINNASQRREALKAIIRRLHAGEPVESVKQDFAEILTDVGGDEIARIEQELVNEGLDPDQITALCDVHVAVFRESLDQQAAPESVPGHPVFTFRAENIAARRIVDQVEEAFQDLAALPNEATLKTARDKLARLREFNKHYLRKENILFAYLERHDFSGPSKVMWAVHDQIRAGWKALAALVEQELPDDTAALEQGIAEALPPLVHAMREMFYKEENILFPAALARLSEAEWAAIREQEAEIGYCYIQPGRHWQPGVQDAAQAELQAGAAQEIAGAIALDVGLLTPAQINLMLRALPIDITFVDENDEVRYFSQSSERIFPRSPAIIGRKVQNCHPPQSVDRVQRILDDFRAGVRDEAAFWIQLHGMFVHIRYFALRDAEGAYRGTLEVTQNLAPLRALEGERRLLDD